MMRNILQNDRGYTLLESLFQLMVFMIFASISVLMIIWFRDLYNLEKKKDDVNWELFVYDINQYNEQSISGTLTDNETLQMVFLTDPNEQDDRVYNFKLSDAHLYKSSRNGGYEIMLPFVENWDLTVDGSTILMKVVMKDGSIRERRIVKPYVQ
ncbi:competence protein ComGF [Lysinibacillus sp. 2017]|uniref:competence type IV pilus minor pilin ComGF n=1 Tax=unclassified Lysinibacillus TaxID=2636778 RepID=UPI000D529C9F|nr:MULTISPECIES: competence type IV pilus minor pilin ComGF [unclassified Lysinibacillus]AWE08003.1 competence protein ComGF [Lysinibacillus sp. 2017]TGN34870.1 competence protein ComGF [Lysinibacillus sp. S2017]